MGLLLCCMDLTATQIYKLSLLQLRQLCVAEGLSNTGTVRELRPRLLRHLKEGSMADQQEDKMRQASDRTDSSADSVPIRPPIVNDNSHVGSGDGPVPVLVELMRQVPPLTTEEPESILRFAGRLNEIYALGLGDDRTFIVRILPRVSGAVLRFFGDCLRQGWTWEQSKEGLLHEFCPISSGKEWCVI